MSILGTLGPLVQGSPHTRWLRFGTACCFGIAFFLGAGVTFGAAASLGKQIGLAGLPDVWRLSAAGTGLILLASVDLWAVRRARYCPIGIRRQTPRMLLRTYPIPVVAAVWGLDTGLAVTTFRVAAITWGALLCSGLGLGAAHSGMGYAAGFTGPLLLLVWLHPAGRLAHAREAGDPGLGRMLGWRPGLQRASAVCLGLASLLLFSLAATGAKLP